MSKQQGFLATKAEPTINAEHHLKPIIIMERRTTSTKERINSSLTLAGCIICVLLSAACFVSAFSTGGVIG